MRNFLIVILIAAAAIGLYFGFIKKKNPPPVEQQQQQSETATGPSVSWKIEEAPDDKNGNPQTKVTLTFNGKVYDAGIHTGSCSEIGASGGIDGKGLLPNEISGVQCWFAGAGEEIGIFKIGDGYIVNLGMLSEGDVENPFFRGTLEGYHDLP